jgi:hypothetical protein
MKTFKCAICIALPLIFSKSPGEHFLVSSILAHGQKKQTINDPLLIEQTEIAAWRDLLDAAPDSLRLANGMQHKDIGGGMAINFQKMPIPLFNRVIGLGLKEPLTQEIIDQVKSYYTHHEKYLVHYSSPVKPRNADSLLKENGFYLAGSWDRIIRDDQPLQLNKSPNDIVVRQVDESLKESWVKFLIDTYGFDFYTWPRAFALRKGWKHYVAFRNNKIVACRSFFMTQQKTIFSGVDAPVPGVMTADCEPDFEIWKRAIQDGLREGATLFVADIELPDKEKNKAAYEGFRQLGFTIPYTRFHYRLNK